MFSPHQQTNEYTDLLRQLCSELDDSRLISGVAPLIQELALAVGDDDPFVAGIGDIRKLEGGQGLYRLRVGDFRVIFRFAEGELVVLILRVRNRREAYRD